MGGRGLLRLFGLFGRAPAPDLNALALPPPAWPGDPERGAAIAAGRLICARHEFVADHPGWFAEGASAEALDALHGFGWLADLAAADSPEARRRAAALVSDWLERGERRRAIDAATGDRIAALLSHVGFLAPEPGDPLRHDLANALGRQIAALARRPDVGQGVDRLRVLRGLIYGHLFTADEAALLHDLAGLQREVELQILPDGGHITRSPAILAQTMALLLDVSDALRAADRPAPAWLAGALDRMVPMLALFRHRDGGLASFNGAGGEPIAALEALAARGGRGDTAPARAPDSRYLRLAATDTLLIMDVGAAPPAPFDRDAHAGALSFEFAHGGARLIVNCGAQIGAGDAWRNAQRATAAHTTVTIDDTNSRDLTPTGIGVRRAHVEWSYETDDGRHWVTAQHDGYAANFGLMHRRRIFLAVDGEDLRGEDAVTGAHRGAFTARFHLHPGVRASVVHNGAAVLLRAANGDAWRFQASGGALGVAESVYFGEAGPSRRSEQITLSGGLTGGETVIKWALRRADPR